MKSIEMKDILIILTVVVVLIFGLIFNKEMRELEEQLIKLLMIPVIIAVMIFVPVLIGNLMVESSQSFDISQYSSKVKMAIYLVFGLIAVYFMMNISDGWNILSGGYERY